MHRVRQRGYREEKCDAEGRVAAGADERLPGRGKKQEKSIYTGAVMGAAPSGV